MFDQMKAMGAVAGLLKDKDRLRRVGETVRADLEASRVSGQAGGGAARVTANGLGRIIDVTLDPAMLSGATADDESRRYAEELITEAVNEALRKGQALMREEASSAARELGLPELPGLDSLLSG